MACRHPDSSFQPVESQQWAGWWAAPIFPAWDPAGTHSPPANPNVRSHPNLPPARKQPLSSPIAFSYEKKVDGTHHFWGSPSYKLWVPLKGKLPQEGFEEGREGLFHLCRPQPEHCFSVQYKQFQSYLPCWYECDNMERRGAIMISFQMVASPFIFACCHRLIRSGGSSGME